MTDDIILWLDLAAVLACAGLLFYFLRRRKESEPARAPIEEFSFSANGVTFRGVRYPRPSAPPLLLVHGYTGNSRNWRELGYFFHAQGYDVWMPNLRGHGKGGHRSVVTDGADGKYGFAEILAVDLPEMIEHVFKESGRKMSVIAHSLGGIAARSLLSGTRRDDEGRFSIDVSLARHLADARVDALVTIGSPVHFHHFPTVLRLILKQPSRMLELLQLAIPVPSSNRSPTAPDRSSLLDRWRAQLFTGVRLTLEKRNLIRGVVEVANFDRTTHEFARLLEKGISKVHGDLVHDINTWAKRGRVSGADDFDFTAPRKLFVPILLVAGEFDQLAPAASVFELAEELDGESDVRSVFFRKTSHVDLISGNRAAQRLGPVLVKFLRHPSSLGKSGVRLEI